MSTAISSPMRQRTRRLALVSVLVLLAILVAALWEPVRRANAMAALEREVGAGNECKGWSTEHGIGAQAFEWLDEGLERNTTYQVYRSRLMGMMEGPIDHVAIHIEHRFHGDPAAALSNFPRLHTVYIQEAATGGSLLTEENGQIKLMESGNCRSWSNFISHAPTSPIPHSIRSQDIP